MGSAQLLFYVILHLFISFSLDSSFHLPHFLSYLLSFLHIFFLSFCHLFHPSFIFFCTSLIICIILFCSPLMYTAHRTTNNTDITVTKHQAPLTTGHLELTLPLLVLLYRGNSISLTHTHRFMWRNVHYRHLTYKLNFMSPELFSQWAQKLDHRWRTG